jgi:2-polyprenyl-3-methyl-5-hydroxy-6-metoxy-1,4-benzoquinol methylase
MTTLSVCICGSDNTVCLQEFSAPPKGEINFISLEKYHRSLRQCTHCSHILQRHQMNLDGLYSHQYVDATYGLEMKMRFEKIVNLPPESSDNRGRAIRVQSLLKLFFGGHAQNFVRILDVGSGLGVFPYQMRLDGWDCIALDPDARSVALAHEYGTPAILADFFEIEDEQHPIIFLKTFQCVTFNKVLEHVIDPIIMLSKAHMLLGAEGMVYVELPDGEAALSESCEREEFFLEHYHVFSLASACILITRAGFVPVRVERLKDPSGKYTLWGVGKKV